MTRAIFIIVVSAVLGLSLGVLLAGTEIGALGAIVGCALGLLWLSVRSNVPHVRNDVTPEHLHRELLCVPRGRVADCTLLRDKNSGIWLDVEQCSLQEDKVRCSKRCLVLMNDVAV